MPEVRPRGSNKGQKQLARQPVVPVHSNLITGLGGTLSMLLPNGQSTGSSEDADTSPKGVPGAPTNTPNDEGGVPLTASMFIDGNVDMSGSTSLSKIPRDM